MDGAQAGPGEVADLTGDHVGVEVLGPVRPAASLPSASPDEGVGDGERVLASMSTAMRGAIASTTRGDVAESRRNSWSAA